ncbi:hypothetical protein [Eggerthella sp. YY7918]|uniref:hypothetical protein n=1 Tax=Eggerthella sp. (strain YY7918) TaxID=502558 RepID=UPI0002F519C7|nr:hypothetical protein [Eggerthella sp. YY7918]
MMRGEETIPVLEEVMQTYLAHYRSPAASDARATGVFEFESDARAGSKGNLRDARLKMLELYGKDAVSWNIDKVERKCASKPVQDGQLALDFRPPKVERKRAKRKEWW